jgi:hypothetical protein
MLAYMAGLKVSHWAEVMLLGGGSSGRKLIGLLYYTYFILHLLGCGSGPNEAINSGHINAFTLGELQFLV